MLKRVPSLDRVAAYAGAGGSLLILAQWITATIAHNAAKAASVWLATAGAFGSFAIALWLAHNPEQRVLWRRVAGLGALVLGMLSASSYFHGKRLLESIESPGKGSFPFLNAIALVMLGFALVVLNRQRRQTYVEVPAFAAAIVSSFSLLMSLYDAQSSSAAGVFLSAALLLMCAGTFAMTPQSRIYAAFASKGRDGFILRQAFPAIALLAVLIGWLSIVGGRAGFIRGNAGTVLLVGLQIVILFALLWWTARSVLRQDEKQKKLEHELGESEERLRLLLEGVMDYAILMLDPDGRVLNWNEAAERMKGYRPEAVIGKHFSIFYLPDDIAEGKPHRSLQDALEKGRYEDTGWRVREDGSRFWANVVITALRNDAGELRGFAMVTRDITDRMMAERAKAEVHALERQTGEIILLREMGSLLHACFTMDEAYTVIAQFTSKLLPDESGVLCILSSGRNLVEATAAWGGWPATESVFSSDDCWAMRTGRIHVVDDGASAVNCAHIRQPYPAYYLCLPMVAQGETLGVLHIQSKRDTQPQECFGSSKQQLAMAAAEQIGLALANIKLRETLRAQSVRDSLSGLYNRRYMEEALEREIRRATRNQGTLGVILLDTDYFKQYNDRYGHDAGDTLLRELGRFLMAQVRGEDIACRYGGDEFMLILPGASLEAARNRAEHFCEEVKRLNVFHNGQPLGKITFSLGVAAFPDHGLTASDILRAADEALYHAKSAGRDRVVVSFVGAA